MEATEDRDEVAAAPSRRRAFLGVLALLAAVVAIAAVTAGVLIARDDGSDSNASTSAQIASVRAACQRWLDSDPGQPGTAGWCGAMADWMTERMGQSGMGPQMMWGDPDRMLATCQQWMSTNAPNGTTIDAQRWCSGMVGWMSDHMGDWDDWGGGMMNRGRR